MRRTWFVALLGCTLQLAACEDGTAPDPDGGPDFEYVLDAGFERTDTSIVVDGEEVLEFPLIHRSVRLYRHNHFSFGGFPELGYEQGDRMMDFWGLVLSHQEPPLLRNDSTILLYVDHGTVAVEEVELDKETTIPTVPAGESIGYENYVLYTLETFARIVWTGGDTTDLTHAEFHDRMTQGAAIELLSTGSAHANAADDSIDIEPIATLTAIINGEEVELDVDEAPTLSAAEDLIFEFDNELDPEDAFIRLVPFTAVAGARSVFIQPKRGTDRVVIPATLLSALVEGADAERVAYYVVVEEYIVEAGAFSGTRPGGAAFSLPLLQTAETALHVWIAQ